MLRSFAAGHPPAPGELVDAAAAFAIELERAPDVLAAEGLVHTDPASGAVLVAYPLSGRPRGRRVLIDGKHSVEAVEAMCAIDALGIAPMLELPTEIRSDDPISGGEVCVRIDPGEGAWWEPEHAVVLAADLWRSNRVRTQELTGLPVTRSDGVPVGVLRRDDPERALER